MVKTLLIITSLAFSLPGTADKTQTLQWAKIKGTHKLSVEKSLNKKQLTLINSGFSTASKLIVLPLGGRNKKPLYQNSCVVRFDTWEEKYEFTSFQAQPIPKTSTNIADYFETCLTAKLDPKVLEASAKTAEKDRLLVVLSIKQISESQSKQLKDWLIKQQSGVIQGLFSHMLGELKVEESITLEVSVPGFNERSELFMLPKTQISKKPTKKKKANQL